MKKSWTAFVSIGFAALVTTVSAEEAGFKNTLSVGVTLTDGNSETLQANAALVSEGAKEGLGSVRAGVEANYGESKLDDNKETTVENARVFANTKKTISARTFASLDLVALYDDIAEIDYRVIASPGAGVYLLKTDMTSLYIEIGPSYIWENVDGASDDYFAVRFAERFSLAISPTARVWQSLEYVPKAEDFGDYLLNAELGAEAAINTRMNLRLVLQNKHDSTPGANLERNDLALIAGISVSL